MRARTSGSDELATGSTSLDRVVTAANNASSCCRRRSHRDWTFGSNQSVPDTAMGRKDAISSSFSIAV
jgi:hypothetical protein